MTQCDWMILGHKVTFRTCEALIYRTIWTKCYATEFGFQKPGSVGISFFWVSILSTYRCLNLNVECRPKWPNGHKILTI